MMLQQVLANPDHSTGGLAVDWSRRSLLLETGQCREQEEFSMVERARAD